MVSDTPHLREKTSKTGLISRAAALFRVDEIIVYPDEPRSDQTAEMDLVALLLSYAETPQYLRKRLFSLKPELQYAGILPPLRTPHHPLNRRAKNLKIGERREGATFSKTNEGTLIDIGVEQPALLPNKQLALGKRVTVQIESINKQVKVELVSRDDISEYWGYMVNVEKQPLGRILRSRDFDLTIATSKYGVVFAHVAVQIVEKWRNARNIIVAFGAPSRGLYEIVKLEGLSLNDVVDFVVNTIPTQGTETVRTEEALIASLSVLSWLWL